MTQRRRRLSTLLIAAGAAVLAAVLVGALLRDDPHEWPDGGWRPYAESSPFNQRIPAKPRLDPRSEEVVRTLTAANPGPLMAGTHGTDNDWGRPVYFAREDDPSFRVHCTRDWGRCELEGLRIRVPEDARPAGARDAHLTVVDPKTGWESDLWKVERIEDGEIVAAWGGRTRIDGDGLGSAAVAANFGTLAGLVRPEELEAGRIRHALFMITPCVSRVAGQDHVYPAVGGARICTDDRDAPLLGARVQLAMSAAEIDDLDIRSWQKTLLRAMAEYGMFVGDTGGPAGWALQQVSDTSYASLGHEPKLEAFAKRQGWTAVEDDLGERSGRTFYLGRFGEGVDWRSRLRVVHPCVSAGTCGR